MTSEAGGTVRPYEKFKPFGNDTKATTIYEQALTVLCHRRLAPLSARSLACLEFEEWEWVIREVIGGHDLAVESAITATAIALAHARDASDAASGLAQAVAEAGLDDPSYGLAAVLDKVAAMTQTGRADG